MSIKSFEPVRWFLTREAQSDLMEKETCKISTSKRSSISFRDKKGKIASPKKLIPLKSTLVFCCLCSLSGEYSGCRQWWHSTIAIGSIKKKLMSVPQHKVKTFLFGDRNFQHGNARQNIFNRLNDVFKREE